MFMIMSHCVRDLIQVSGFRYLGPIPSLELSLARSMSMSSKLCRSSLSFESIPSPSVHIKPLFLSHNLPQTPNPNFQFPKPPRLVSPCKLQPPSNSKVIIPIPPFHFMIMIRPPLRAARAIHPALGGGAGIVAMRRRGRRWLAISISVASRRLVTILVSTMSVFGTRVVAVAVSGGSVLAMSVLCFGTVVVAVSSRSMLAMAVAVVVARAGEGGVRGVAFEVLL